MSEIKYQKLDTLLKYLPKSKIKAGDGKDVGKYHFYTSSSKLKKFLDISNYENESIILGSGGLASLHYCNEAFSTSTDCFVLTTENDDFDLKYVYYYLKSNMRLLENGFKGVGLKHISKKYISNIKIPVQALENQRKISTFLTQIERLIQKREESIKLLDELIESTYLDMFVFNEERESWNEVNISDLAMQEKGSMRTGPFGSDLLHSEFSEFGDVAVLGIDNAVSNKFLWKEKRFITLKKYETLKRYTIYPNDIIITIMGTIGRTAVIPNDIPIAINTKHLAAITPNLEVVNPYFLAYSLRQDPDIKKQIKKKTKGALLDGLNLTIIKNLKIKLPKKNLQDKFADMVTQIEQSKITYQDSLKELNNLFNSTAQKAFKGELDISKIDIKQTQKKEALKMLDKEQVLELIKQGNFDPKDYVNAEQSYDSIRDMIFKLLDDKNILHTLDIKTDVYFVKNKLLELNKIESIKYKIPYNTPFRISTFFIKKWSKEKPKIQNEIFLRVY